MTYLVNFMLFSEYHLIRQVQIKMLTVMVLVILKKDRYNPQSNNIKSLIKNNINKDVGFKGWVVVSDIIQIQINILLK